MFAAWGLLFFMTEGHAVYALREKETQTRLSLLYERELFPEAIALGSEWGLSEKEMSEIHRMFGDWLYEKKEFADAMREYIFTIGFLDASYVIRRFLDAAQIHNLTAYLEELHRSGKATVDHTVLLMNNYVKLHSNEKIQAFVYQNALGAQFDVPAVIDVLVKAGYFREALYLAQSHRIYERVLSIQIDESGAFRDAIDFVATLSDADAAKLLQRYGKRLVDAEPEATSQLLLRLCTAPGGVEPERFFHCFVDNAAALKSFLQRVVEMRPQCGTSVWNTLLELLLRSDLAPGESREALTEKVMALLRDPKAKYDPDEALFLLQRGKCEEGLLFVCLKLRLSGMLVRLYFEAGQREEARKLCEEEKGEEALWELLLQLYAESEDYAEEEKKKKSGEKSEEKDEEKSEEKDGEKEESEKKEDQANEEKKGDESSENKTNDENDSNKDSNETNENTAKTSESSTEPSSQPTNESTNESTNEEKGGESRAAHLIDRQELQLVISKVLASGRVPLLRIVQILSESQHIDASLIRQVVVAQLEDEKRRREEVESPRDVNDRTSSRPHSCASSESAWNRSSRASRTTPSR